MLQLSQSSRVWGQHYSGGLCWSFLCSAFLPPPHLELIHSLQNKLPSCLVREVAQSRSVLATEAGQACAGSHPQEPRSLLLLPSQVLTSQRGDAISEVGGLEMDHGPVVWASSFPSSKANWQNQKTTVANFCMSLWTQLLLLMRFCFNAS